MKIEPLDRSTRDSRYSARYRANHPEQRKASSKKYRESHRDKLRKYDTERYQTVRRFSNYGISREEYESMLIGQGNRCGVCGGVLGTGKDTHIDHDHATGRVRGILCSGCNIGLGAFGDNPDVLSDAAAYLRRFK